MSCRLLTVPNDIEKPFFVLDPTGQTDASAKGTANGEIVLCLAAVSLRRTQSPPRRSNGSAPREHQTVVSESDPGKLRGRPGRFPQVREEVWRLDFGCRDALVGGEPA